MKKGTVFIILSLFIQSLASSQDCLPEGITFTAQEQIDNFQINYPNCSEIGGDVTIQGEDISNLNGLNSITLIDGTLCIKKNGSLTSIAGFSSLEHIEHLMIINNDKLESLHGLESLDTINGRIQIWYNDMLANLSGLDNISHIRSDLMIEGNYSQINCRGLENLTCVEGSLVIGCIAGWMHYNRSMKSLSGFDNLRHVGGLLWINCNDSINNLSGLENLVSIGDGLVINGNKSLINLHGLENLNSCGGRIIIGGWWEDCDGNPRLVSLQGIENIDPGSIDELRIKNNTSLTNCNIRCICDYLVNPYTNMVICENAYGCNTVQEVEDACESFGIDEEKKLSMLSVHPNPSVDGYITFTFNNPHSTSIDLYCSTILGSAVYQGKMCPPQCECRIYVRDWKAGIYFAEAVAEGKSVGRLKFVVH